MNGIKETVVIISKGYKNEWQQGNYGSSRFRFTSYRNLTAAKLKPNGTR